MHCVAEVAKAFGSLPSRTETLGEFRYGQNFTAETLGEFRYNEQFKIETIIDVRSKSSAVAAYR